LPGAVDTPMLHAGINRGHLIDKDIIQKIENLGKKHVIGRIGRPEEVAQGILFLADNEQSSFMTGQALIIDGGATARLSTE
jgi:glucose 1-dehydrogenase